MTKEEAQKYLINFSYALGNMSIEYLCEKAGEKMREAISVLEQEPCEDVISRQVVKNKYRESLINTLIDTDRGIDLSDFAEKPYEAFCKFIDSIPPVKLQKPKTGHWIIMDDCEDFIAKCSECGRVEDSRMISRYPYCHCGARMIEREG